MTEDADLQISVQNVDEARTLLGPLDSNARLIRELHGVNVLVRDGSLRLLGPAQAVAQVRDVLQGAVEALRQGKEITPGHVARRLGDAAGMGGQTPEPAPEPIAAGRHRTVQPRTDGQRRYLDSLRQNDVVFGVGPAGTGKTFLAVAAAVEAVRNGEVRRIVLVRPAVEAGEKLGFLPGDFQAKVDPYLRPLHDALKDLLDDRTRARFIETDVVEICPLAYMRGRTLNEAFVILDEGQNTTVSQMLMFLTRMGEASRMVVTGDPTQVDLPDRVASGLADAVRRLRRVDGVGIVELDEKDVVRHTVVQRIIRAYGDIVGERARQRRTR